MIELPNAHRALVEDVKVRDYLLNPVHSANLGKAGLYKRFGFERAAWPVLAAALVAHAVRNPVVAYREDEHGQFYDVRCNIDSPDGRNPCIKSVWMIKWGTEFPRLVTAY